MRKINLNSKKFKRGSTSLILTAIVIISAILLNIVVGLTVDRFNFKFDITQKKLYELTDTTKQVVSNLKQPVTLYVMSSENSFLDELKEVVTRYKKLSDNITIKYIDPYKNPNFVNKYQSDGTTIYENDIIAETSTRHKVISIYSMYDFDENQNVTGFKAEQQITSALQYVTTASLPDVLFTDGHNEAIDSSFKSMFENNNYNVTTSSISVSGIPENAQTVVICGPTRDFSSDEIKALNDFMLKRAGKLMVFLDASAQTPNLDSFLNEWGIGVKDDIVFEKDRYTASNPLYIAAYYEQHDITTNLWKNNNYYTVMPGTRALDILFTDKDNITTAKVLISSTDSYGKTGTTFQTSQRENKDSSGPFVLAATASMPQTTADGKQDYARLFVAGNSNMYLKDITSSTTFANSAFINDVIGWCSKGMEIVNVPVKDTQIPPLNVLAYQALLFAGLYIIIIPGSILAFGIVVWFRRRHL